MLPENLSPVSSTSNEPEETQENIDSAHDGVEWQERIVSDGEESSSWPQWHVDRGGDWFSIIHRLHMNNNQVNTILGNSVDWMLTSNWSNRSNLSFPLLSTLSRDMSLKLIKRKLMNLHCCILSWASGEEWWWWWIIERWTWNECLRFGQNFRNIYIMYTTIFFFF